MDTVTENVTIMPANTMVAIVQPKFLIRWNIALSQVTALMSFPTEYVMKFAILKNAFLMVATAFINQQDKSTVEIPVSVKMCMQTVYAIMIVM